MSVVAARRPRCIGAMATHLNAGLWGSRFVGECQIGTNGETVWVRGWRVPVWVSWVRMISCAVFVPVGFYAGVVLGETLVGHWGYPPYYYLASALLTFLLVVIGTWGAGIWTETLSTYQTLAWKVPKGVNIAGLAGVGAAGGTKLWNISNRLFSVTGLVQVHVPIGPGGAPRRLVLKAYNGDARTVELVLSGVYYGQTN
jgi:hypothetical protein